MVRKGLEGCAFKIEVSAAENEEQWGKDERVRERFRARGGFEAVPRVLGLLGVEGLARDRRVKELEGKLIEMKRPPVVASGHKAVNRTGAIVPDGLRI